jgi:hypothetical protein
MRRSLIPATLAMLIGIADPQAGAAVLPEGCSTEQLQAMAAAG